VAGSTVTQFSKFCDEILQCYCQIVQYCFLQILFK